MTKGTRYGDESGFDFERTPLKAKADTVWKVISAIVAATAITVGTAVWGYRDIKDELKANTAAVADLSKVAATRADVAAGVTDAKRWAWDLFASNRDNKCPRPLWMFRGPDHIDCKLALPTWERP